MWRAKCRGNGTPPSPPHQPLGCLSGDELWAIVEEKMNLPRGKNVGREKIIGNLNEQRAPEQNELDGCRTKFEHEGLQNRI